ncbi:hypothetical protein F1B92_07370 [Campylobacter sp. FMV-PI01]|uniref:DNA polymerase III subunit delta n=1 Tax=Campylobacter portucalensis TaxID=2608384 RepID=A0A6L5WI81_9BACT|nr:DNA polymerase III subunit delta' [Campylobacter portucalensis]MSN96978.1 hypothetical protein [Campylobacter portucalensis]
MNKIIITNDFEALKDELLSQKQDVKFFENSEILLEDTKNAIKEAYIAEDHLKTIVLMGYKFRHEAQNSLLLILEESPKNIEFILVSSSKSVFLKTIISRLSVENRLQVVFAEKTGLNFANLTLKDLTNFINAKIELEKKDMLDKNDLKKILESIIFECFEMGFKFSQKELEYINKLMILINLNTKARAVLTPLLLMINEKTRR